MKTNQKEPTSEVESLAASVVCGTQLEQIAREGAQKMIKVALQLEVEQASPLRRSITRIASRQRS